MPVLSKYFLYFLFLAWSVPALALESYEGRANFWSLYLTDNFDSTTVVLVYQDLACTDLDYVLARPDEAQLEGCGTAFCCQIRKIINGETVVERQIESPEDGSTITTNSFDTGDTLLTNIGIDAEAQEKSFDFYLKGDVRRSWLGDRALYGTSDKNRFRFLEAFAQYKDDRAVPTYSLAVGRQPIQAGVLVDGVSGSYYFGSEGYRESKKVGLFAGLSPNPITKEPSTDFMTFGADFHFIPDFSNTSETKLRLDASIVSELFEGSLNRFYLFSRSHFSPLQELSFFHYSTIELPAPSGDDSGLNSSHFALQSLYRPNRQWFLSLGFSQFRIDRFLAEESVRWVTDDNSRQELRVGETLDRSDRYRVDFRASYRPRPIVQPYIRARYERRNFDSNKTNLNIDPADPDNIQQNLRLVSKKEAYSGMAGLRLFPLPQLETQSEFHYQQRFLSDSRSVYQAAYWDSGQDWTADAYFQVFWSDRLIANSIPGQPSEKVDTTDYYLGVGGSYKIRSDLLGQIRYDFSHEDDHSLARAILVHSVLLRLDYRF